MKKTILFVLLGLFIAMPVSAQQVVLDHVDGTWYDGWAERIIPYCEGNVTFYIRFINNTPDKIGSISNGFKLTSTSGVLTPMTLQLVDTSFYSRFTLAQGIYPTNGDGISPDVGGVIFAGWPEDQGLDPGYNDIVLSITTGGIAEGETLCLDSSYFPPNNWVWGGSIYPSWDGPHCYTAVQPSVMPAMVTNCPDTIKIPECSNVGTFDFDTDKPAIFEVIEGPGTIDSITGRWIVDLESEPFSPLLKIGLRNNVDYCQTYYACGVTLVMDYYYVTMDINYDCGANLADLLYLVDYMFDFGPPPYIMEMADCNGDTQVNLADLLRIVDYMFAEGDACVPFE